MHSSYSRVLTTAQHGLGINDGLVALLIDIMTLSLHLQPVDPGEVYQDMAGGAEEDVAVDVGVQFNASVMKGEQSLV